MRISKRPICKLLTGTRTTDFGLTGSSAGGVGDLCCTISSEFCSGPDGSDVYAGGAGEEGTTSRVDMLQAGRRV